MSAETRLLRWPHDDREAYGRFAAALDRIRTVAARARGEIVVGAPQGPEEPSDLDRARALLAHRRARDRAAGVDADLFGEPAWDVLLVLFIGQEEGRVLCLDDVFGSVGVRTPVQERWRAVMERRDIVRVGGYAAASIIALTDAGTALVQRCVRDA